jgi:hypothetical protein
MSAQLAEKDVQMDHQELEDEYDERDATHPFTEHSTIPSGQAFVFSQVDNSRGDVLISSASDPEKVIYKVSSHVSINRSRPKIVLSWGGNPIAHLFHHWTTGYRIGIDRGGSGDESLMQWVELKRGGFTALNKSYLFEWKGRTYVLARMREPELGVRGSKKWLRHYKVVEKDSGEVVATYLTEAAFGKRTGTLTLQHKVDPDLSIIIVTGIAEWREMARRQQRTVGAVVA